MPKAPSAGPKTLSSHVLAFLQDGRVSLKPRTARRDLGALAAVHFLVHCPVFGVGRLNGSLLICLRKDVALVSHCVPGLGQGTKRLGGRRILCAPSWLTGGSTLPLAHENTVFARITFLTDTVFARISLLAGWPSAVMAKKGPCALPRIRTSEMRISSYRCKLSHTK
ncbi:hypothetical protein [Desulfosporosinus sp. OT]|uniref:hypothetical protein n=1 Tax=Desulfosporosinus sp. OT TaxID=913865 RepID=UPI0011123E9C|nr:hypothetical protein [Desulfosporosinus sp. OT]